MLSGKSKPAIGGGSLVTAGWADLRELCSLCRQSEARVSWQREFRKRWVCFRSDWLGGNRPQHSHSSCQPCSTLNLVTRQQRGLIATIRTQRMNHRTTDPSRLKHEREDGLPQWPTKEMKGMKVLPNLTLNVQFTYLNLAGAVISLFTKHCIIWQLYLIN